MTEWWRVTPEDNPLGLNEQQIKRVNGFMSKYYEEEKVKVPASVMFTKERKDYKIRFRKEERKIKEGRKCFGSPEVHVFCKDTCAIRVQCHSRREAWLRLLARPASDRSGQRRVK